MRKRTREQLAAAAHNLLSKPTDSGESLRAFVLRNERDRLWEAFMALTRVYATKDEDAIEEQGRVFAGQVRAILERVDDLNSLDEIEKEGG